MKRATRILGILLMGFAGLLVIVLVTYLYQRLPFVVIAQGSFINYHQEQPQLLVIAATEDIDGLAETILLEDSILADQLRNVNYSQSIALMALHGEIGSGGYGISVRAVTHRDNRVTVWADFSEPALFAGRTPAFTSPYQIIVVPKNQLTGNSIGFILMKGFSQVAEITRFIP